MRLLGILVLAACTAACTFKPAKLLSSYTHLEVREVGRSRHCNADRVDPAAYLFPDAAGVAAWQAPRSLSLLPADAPADAPYVLVELGDRATGGYGIAVSRAAVLRGELLILSATFVSPGPGSIVTQALTSPCVLVRLPPGRYSAVEIQDQTGAVRATGKAMSANVTP